MEAVFFFFVFGSIKESTLFIFITSSDTLQWVTKVKQIKVCQRTK